MDDDENLPKFSFEAIIGLVGMVLAIVIMIFFFSQQRELFLIDKIVNTRVADILIRIPTSTMWIVTVTPTFTPTPPYFPTLFPITPY